MDVVYNHMYRYENVLNNTVPDYFFRQNEDGSLYNGSGCGYEYVPELGDEDGEIAPGTLFEQLPAEWVCPECAETKDQFVKA